MRTVALVAAVALLSAALAGCASEDPERYPRGSTTSSSRTASSSSTSTTGAPANATNSTNGVPTANLTASPTHGTTPLNVTFEINGTDPDGDALNWTLTFGDGNSTNGTSLPATVVHAYSVTGNLTAVLTVSDGNASARARVNVTLAGSGPLAPSTQCDRVPTMTEGPMYVFEGDGGTWAFVEANDIPGLQVENNHPSEATGQAETLGEHNAAWEGCENGDQMVF